jgi:predicted acyltransferase
MIASAPASGRRLSLDLFRGLTIMGMILVNTEGEGAPAYPVIVHADWFGFTGADLVFPSFLFAMGSALALTGRVETGEGAFWAKVLRRGAVIFGLGVLLYWFPFVQKDAAGHWGLIPFAGTRLMGVLQRTALCYVIAAVAARFLGPKGLIALSLALLAGYWTILLTCAPPAQALTKMGNFGNVIDIAVLGKSHLYRWDGGFDPEGLLGTLPSIVNVIAGYLAARFLKGSEDLGKVVVRFAATGLVLALAALALSLVVPIGKKLWTPSFVGLTVGLDLMIMALFVQVYDRMGWRFGQTALQPLGLNPLVIYLFSELFVVVLGLVPAGGTDVWTWFCKDIMQKALPGANGALGAAVVYLFVCWLVAYVMEKRRIYVRI